MSILDKIKEDFYIYCVDVDNRVDELVRTTEAWIQSLIPKEGEGEEHGDSVIPIFPKTPNGLMKRSRKRPIEATIFEEESIEVKEFSDEAFKFPAPITKCGTRAAAKNANKNMKLLNSMKLNSKLRQPSVDFQNVGRQTRSNSSSVIESKITVLKKYTPVMVDSDISSDSDSEIPLARLHSMRPPPRKSPKLEELVLEIDARNSVQNAVVSSSATSEPAVVETVLQDTADDLDIVDENLIKESDNEDEIAIIEVPKITDSTASHKDTTKVIMNSQPSIHLIPVAAGSFNHCRIQTPPSLSVKKRVECYEKLVPEVNLGSPVQMPVRITRTKAKAMAETIQKKTCENSELLKKLARKSLNRAKKVIHQKQVNLADSVGKENSVINESGLKHVTMNTSTTKKLNPRVTPLSTSRVVSAAAHNIPLVQNNMVVGLTTFLQKSNKITAVTQTELEEKKREKKRKKEVEAMKKRQELMNLKTEQRRMLREEKSAKVLSQREALEREKTEQQIRLDKEKEERARQAAEREGKLKEEMLKKKIQAQQKAAEIEERRKNEENARLQRLKEQEEEHRKIQAQRKKEAEAAECLRLKRLKEEKDSALLREARLAAAAAKKVAPLDGTFVKVKRPPLRTGSKDQYPLEDLSEGASESEDEGTRPNWSSTAILRQRGLCQVFVPSLKYVAFFQPATMPDISTIFNNRLLKNRFSVAPWHTPPRYSQMPK